MNAPIKGLCQKFCPAKDFEDRARVNDFSPFEMGLGVPIKAYQRAAAGIYYDAESIRPLPVLIDVVHHLIDVVIGKMIDNSRQDTSESAMYFFVENRFRCITQEIRFQRLKGPEVIWIHEKLALFLLFSAVKLRDYREFDEKPNRDRLSDTFVSLEQLYDEEYQAENERSPNEAFFRALHSLIFDVNRPFGDYIAGLDEDLILSEPIQKSMAIFEALISNEPKKLESILIASPVQYSAALFCSQPDPIQFNIHNIWSKNGFILLGSLFKHLKFSDAFTLQTNQNEIQTTQPVIIKQEPIHQIQPPPPPPQALEEEEKEEEREFIPPLTIPSIPQTLFTSVQEKEVIKDELEVEVEEKEKDDFFLSVERTVSCPLTDIRDLVGEDQLRYGYATVFIGTEPSTEAKKFAYSRVFGESNPILKVFDGRFYLALIDQSSIDELLIPHSIFFCGNADVEADIPVINFTFNREHLDVREFDEMLTKAIEMATVPLSLVDLGDSLRKAVAMILGQ